MKSTPSLVFATSAGIVVIIAVIAGLIALGPPAQNRAKRLDDERVHNLQNIASSINEYVHTHGSLPATLEAIQQSGERTFWHLQDAETGLPYEYKVKDGTNYELCAQFDTASEYAADTSSSGISPFWNHGQGQHCFGLEAKAPKQP